jgi:hypothetical protein
VQGYMTAELCLGARRWSISGEGREEHLVGERGNIDYSERYRVSRYKRSEGGKQTEAAITYSHRQSLASI